MTTQGKIFVAMWSLGLVFLYVVSWYSGMQVIRGSAAESTKSQAASQAMPAPKPPSGVESVDVLVGVNINRGGDFDLKQSTWRADFDLWFLWSADMVMPGENFQLVNGEILQQNIRESYAEGAKHYLEYNIVANMKMDFDPTRFPFGEVCLQIPVKDTTRGAVRVRYVADEQHSGIVPGAHPRAAAVRSFAVTAGSSEDTARPGFGGTPGAKPEGRSLITASAWIVPQGLGIYRRMFQALFASVAVALIALYIKPTHVDCRFGLPVGGFFASVGNNIYVGSLLPYGNAPTLTDAINFVSLLTIFLILVQSVMSLYIYDTLGREQQSILFDRVSLVIFLVGYLALNVSLPMAAFSR